MRHHFRAAGATGGIRPKGSGPCGRTLVVGWLCREAPPAYEPIHNVSGDPSKWGSGARTEALRVRARARITASDYPGFPRPRDLAFARRSASAANTAPATSTVIGATRLRVEMSTSFRRTVPVLSPSRARASEPLRPEPSQGSPPSPRWTRVRAPSPRARYRRGTRSMRRSQRSLSIRSASVNRLTRPRGLPESRPMTAARCSLRTSRIVSSAVRVRSAFWNRSSSDKVSRDTRTVVADALICSCVYCILYRISRMAELPVRALWTGMSRRHLGMR